MKKAKIVSLVGLRLFSVKSSLRQASIVPGDKLGGSSRFSLFHALVCPARETVMVVGKGRITYRVGKSETRASLSTGRLGHD